ncbi:glutathione S-transferase family protein [Roseomonas sp. NAR14]|uniref:Glutathione S-transferase family protein n=1 Tax=Roseomonas acroporae TaxID=2937791 RepID=A0A9X2BV16_9PROT|nr:glutathione S-transferase family protein [Roseomonas acroporae]MCK8783554.1 glutathione S-transferase family protein [Roseomonas acroporae]
MGYVLYGDIGSGSATAEMALAEIGAPVELRDVPLAGEAQLAAEYRALNPMGRVPTLVLPDGTVVTESLAVLLTLCDRHPEAGLLPPPDGPSGDPGRAKALRWMALLAGEFYPCVTRYDYPERFSDDPAHAPSIRARALEMGRAVWRVVEDNAAPDPFVLGTRFSVADIYVAVLSQWTRGQATNPVEHPRVSALVRRVAARPAIAPVWAKHFGGRGLEG